MYITYEDPEKFFQILLAPPKNDDYDLKATFYIKSKDDTHYWPTFLSSDGGGFVTTDGTGRNGRVEHFTFAKTADGRYKCDIKDRPCQLKMAFSNENKVLDFEADFAMDTPSAHTFKQELAFSGIRL